MSINNAYYITGQAGVFPLGYGLPGWAKSASLAALAHATEKYFYCFLPATHEPTDASGLPAMGEFKMDDKGVIKCMEMVSPRWVLKALLRPAVLVVDELTCCTPAMQSAIMGMVLEGRVGDMVLPENTLRYGLCNPPDIASNGFPLEAPLANRMMHYQWKFPRKDWVAGMHNGQEFPSPEPPVLPDNWKKEIYEMSAVVAEFHEACAGFLYPETDEHGMVVLSNSERSRAYPSPRSWSMAARAMAAAKSVNASDDVVNEIVEGCVGQAAASAFDSWNDYRDIPLPEPVISAVSSALSSKQPDEMISNMVPNMGRADKVRVFLSSVTGCIIDNNSRERWHAAQEIYRQLIKRHKEVALVCAGPLYKNRPAGVKLSPEMVESTWDVIGRTEEETN